MLSKNGSPALKEPVTIFVSFGIYEHIHFDPPKLETEE